MSRGFAALRSGARASGAAALDGAGRALGELLGAEATLRARAVPGCAAARSAARLAIDFTALPGVGALEVEPALVVRLVDQLAGGSGAASGATALTPVEAAALELLALAALDGACAAPGVEARLAPRLARGGGDPAGALAVELDVRVGEVGGRARLLLPPAAVAALSGDPDPARSPLALGASLRRGGASLAPEELDALAPGDVLVLDGEAAPREALVLPGGFEAVGRLADDGFHVEETHMAERRLELPIRLEVELARVEVTLADLARLEPGAVLPLGIDRQGRVTLRAGDRAVARGELVDVDGAVGVRILALEVAP